MGDAIKISKEILTVNATEKTLAIFDLDSTLFNVSFRTREILNALSNEAFFRERYPNKYHLIQGLTVEPTDWGFRDILQRAKIEAEIEFFETVRNYWVTHFFSSRFLKFDQPYEGAVDYVKSLHDKGVEIRYLTGRDKINMLKGTIESLIEWGFPFNQDLLHMKPHSERADEDYKVDEIKSILTQHKNIWFFENEPTIIEKILNSKLDIKIVFVDTVHSGKAQPPQNLPVINGIYKTTTILSYTQND